ncbi:MAG TPA: hypothetical protein VEI07_04690 [Planctomycetaceae bacterium]|nr:hypothetical protein [Planctomycetaceae bacterium]
MSAFTKIGPTLVAFAVLVIGATIAGLSGCGGAAGVTTGASSAASITIRHGKAEAAAPSEGGAAAAAEGATAAPAGFGTLRGRVVFQGAPPTIEALTAQALGKEPICGKAGVPNDRLVIGEGNGVANVFIFLPKAPGGVPVPPLPTEPAKFDQKSCRFFPHALIVRASQDLKILNSDSVTHNTHTHALRSENYNSSISPHNETGVDFKYQRSEAKPAEVTCDIHSWMKAYHLPLDHPWGAVTGPNGEFEIKNVPAGTHKFQVWHESAGGGGYLDRNLTVTIKPGEVTTKDIPYDASKLEL